MTVSNRLLLCAQRPDIYDDEIFYFILFFFCKLWFNTIGKIKYLFKVLITSFSRTFEKKLYLIIYILYIIDNIQYNIIQSIKNIQSHINAQF